ncbi:cytochrome ubiquinol oxidase subunit I [bacterium]|nr:cytochrome ubiquinol oxidase subunit I [bacterium]
MEITALLLSRIQFGLTIGFHILFPTLTIGLALLLIAHEGLWLATKRAIYRESCRFWARIFAVNFGMGVVSGVVLSYEIGTNFAAFSEATGNVLGPLFSYEVLTAFFLEAGFLGIMLFGWDRVPRWLHFFSTVMVGIGTLISAFWILAANSWMHTPAGFSMQDGVFFVEDWWAIVFNPSFPYRYAHMICASLLTTAFVAAGVGAWHVLNHKQAEFGRMTLRLAVLTAALLAPLQILLGDLHGLNTLEHQPMKVAAMEGHWNTDTGVPLLLFAIPDQAAETNHFEIGIPEITSLILTHDLDGEVKGLTEVPPEDRPPVAPVFWAFRVMVGIGVLFLLLAWSGVVQLLRGRLYDGAGLNRHLLRGLILASPLGFVAVIAGWLVTEIGRQPWVVYGLMRTADSGSATVTAAEVATSLSLFSIIYSVLLVVFVFVVLRMMRTAVGTGPQPSDNTAAAQGQPA